MKKEVVIAIIVGFSLGLVITYGVYRAQNSLKQKAAQDEIIQTEPSLVEEKETNLLSITHPENGTITGEETIAIGGITQKNALISVISNNDEKLTQADNLGNFSIEINLAAGPNQIDVTAFNQAGFRQDKTVYVVYSSYDLESEDE